MTDYYVDASRPNDTGDGLSPMTAKQTVDGVQAVIQEAEDKSQETSDNMRRKRLGCNRG